MTAQDLRVVLPSPEWQALESHNSQVGFLGDERIDDLPMTTM
jgi:hypothetical protein